MFVWVVCCGLISNENERYSFNSIIKSCLGCGLISNENERYLAKVLVLQGLVVD